MGPTTVTSTLASPTSSSVRLMLSPHYRGWGRRSFSGRTYPNTMYSGLNTYPSTMYSGLKTYPSTMYSTTTRWGGQGYSGRTYPSTMYSGLKTYPSTMYSGLNTYNGRFGYNW